MSFSESRINDGLIVYETEGGSMFSTTIITTNSGKEQRNAVWAMPRGKWELGGRMVRQAEAEAVRDYFNAMGGMHTPFRFKDWLDYKDNGKGILGPSGVGDGVATSFQMHKNYTVGPFTRQRMIRKPVSGTVKAFVNGVQHSSPSIDYTTGIITLPAVSKTISGAASVGGNTNFTTTTAHGLNTGDTITFGSLPGGYSALNGLAKTVTVLSSTSFGVAFDSSALTWSGSGSFTYKYQAGHSLTWTGEFDVPVRFDTDELKMRFVAAALTGPGQVSETAWDLGSLPIIEIKV